MSTLLITNLSSKMNTLLTTNVRSKRNNESKRENMKPKKKDDKEK